MKSIFYLILAAVILLFASPKAKAADVYVNTGKFSIGIGPSSVFVAPNPTFRPQPYFYGPPMVYRGDYVPAYMVPGNPYYYHYHRPSPRVEPCHPTHPRAPHYVPNHNHRHGNRPGR